MASNLSI